MQCSQVIVRIVPSSLKSILYHHYQGRKKLTLADVLGHGTAVFEDLKTYLNSLHRMRDRASGRGYPGHGAVIENASARITEYIKHRQQREDEVLHVLKYGSLEGTVVDIQGWTPLELVKQIYKDIPESLHLPASHGIALVLEKLESEGRVVKKDEKWTLSEKSAL